MKTLTGYILMVVGIVFSVFFLALLIATAFTDDAPADTRTDYAAIGFFDCNELGAVTFITMQGKIEIVKIDSPARLLDTEIRMAAVDYSMIDYVVNRRECGFVMDEGVTT